MRVFDQPAVLEWFPTEMRTVRRYQPIEFKRQRMDFESVAAAVSYATSRFGPPRRLKPQATSRLAGPISKP